MFLAPGNTCLYIFTSPKNARRRRRKNIRNACVDEDVGGRDGVLEDELPTIIVLALVTDSESDLDVSVVRERVKKVFYFSTTFPGQRLVVLLVPLDKSKLIRVVLKLGTSTAAHSCIFSGSQCKISTFMII